MFSAQMQSSEKHRSALLKDSTSLYEFVAAKKSNVTYSNKEIWTEHLQLVTSSFWWDPQIKWIQTHYFKKKSQLNTKYFAFHFLFSAFSCDSSGYQQPSLCFQSTLVAACKNQPHLKEIIMALTQLESKILPSWALAHYCIICVDIPWQLGLHSILFQHWHITGRAISSD